MALYKDGNPVSGLNSIPRLTLAQYNALNVKPEFWVRTDAPESYKKLSADQVSYDSNNTVKDMLDGETLSESKTSDSNGLIVTDIPISKKLYGYYFGNYLLLPFASSNVWKFVVADLSNGVIKAQANKTGTLVVYHSV